MLFAACSGGKPKGGGNAPSSPSGGGSTVAASRPIPVTIATAVQKDVPIDVRAVGSVEPYSTVQVKSLVDGQIAKVHFQEGQFVKKDDILFTIDPRPFQAAVAQAEATVAKDQTTLTFAQRAAERSNILVKQKQISAEENDQSVAAAASAAAILKADQAAVETAKLKLQYCIIKSPIDGRTGNLDVNEGNVIKANADNPLVTIVQLEPIYITFSVSERYLGDIHKYNEKGPLKTEAMAPGNREHPITGKLTFINNQVDKTAGTIQLKSTVDNKDHGLWPGEYVDVVLTLTSIPNATVVPSQAVQVSQQGQTVFVVKPDSTVDLRQVVTGQTVGNETVIDSGLKPGEIAVTDGQLRLLPGSKVQEAKTPGQQAAQNGQKVASSQ